MISCRGLSKSFADDGVFDLNLTVNPGESMGLLGPTGAGKSLVMRVLLGQLRPDSGSAAVFGLDCWKQRRLVMRNLAFAPAAPPLEPRSTGEAYLRFVGSYHGGINPRRARDLGERLDIVLTGLCARMSPEARKKLGLLAALAQDKDAYLLDEPFAGLGSLARTALTDILREAVARGACLLVSSHVLEEVRRSCDQVAIIRKGRLVVTQPVEALNLTRQKVYHITFSSADEAASFAREWESAVELIGARALVAVPSSPQALLKTLARYTVADLIGGREESEESFLRFYGDDVV